MKELLGVTGQGLRNNVVLRTESVIFLGIVFSFSKSCFEIAIDFAEIVPSRFIKIYLNLPQQDVRVVEHYYSLGTVSALKKRTHTKI